MPTLGRPEPLSIKPAAPSPPAASPRASARSEPVVTLGDHYYDPPTLTVRVGTTVTWRVVGQQVHDVIASDGSFQASGLGPGSTFAHTFTTRGRFPYFCVPHFGDGMRAEIVVE